jgi:polar amino acid transport system permease protein
MTYAWGFEYLWEFRYILLIGVGISVGYCVLTLLLGLILGLFCGLSLLSKHRILLFPVRSYVEIFRCTPLMVQLIWMYYALPVIVGVNIPAWLAGGLALTCYGSAFFTEIFRGGVQSIDFGQWDAGRALGMTPSQLMRRIILPQAVKRMIPPFINQGVLNLKNTSLLYVIAVGDLLYQGSVITAATYRPLEVYTTIGVIYFIILYPATVLAQRWEVKLAVNK